MHCCRLHNTFCHGDNLNSNSTDHVIESSEVDDEQGELALYCECVLLYMCIIVQHS